MALGFIFLCVFYLSLFTVENVSCARTVAENKNCGKTDFLQNSTYCCRASDVRDDVNVTCYLFSDSKSSELYLSEMFTQISERHSDVQNLSLFLDNRVIFGLKSNVLDLAKVDLFESSLLVFCFKLLDQSQYSMWNISGTDNWSPTLRQNLQVLSLNLNLGFSTNLSFIADCKSLNTLDLSNNKKLGLKPLFNGPNAPLRHLVEFRSLETLNLENVQYGGIEGFMEKFSIGELVHMDNTSQALTIKRLFLNGNSILRFDSGFNVVTPDLEYLGVRSNGMYAPELSCFFFLEMLSIHKSIKVLDLSCQFTSGNDICSNRTQAFMQRFQPLLENTSKSPEKVIRSVFCPFEEILNYTKRLSQQCAKNPRSFINYKMRCDAILECFEQSKHISDPAEKFYNVMECAALTLTTVGPLFRQFLLDICSAVVSVVVFDECPYGKIPVPIAPQL